MKVFVAHFNAECNEHISHIVNRDDFHFLYGDDCVKAMKVEDIFNKNDIEVIPSLYANTSPNGMIGRETFDYICDCILNPLKEHLSEIDGIYLQFHGASGVDGLDCISGGTLLSERNEKNCW